MGQRPAAPKGTYGASGGSAKAGFKLAVGVRKGTVSRSAAAAQLKTLRRGAKNRTPQIKASSKGQLAGYGMAKRSGQGGGQHRDARGRFA